MALKVTITTADDESIIVAAEGEVDVSCASELRDAIDEALSAQPAGVIVDLAQVPYIDSTGIGVLVGAAHRAIDTAVPLRVANPQRNVKRVLGMLRVTDELGITEAEG